MAAALAALVIADASVAHPYSGSATPSAVAAATPPATPRAQCGPGSNPEPSIQGRVPADVVASGRADNGFNCNMSLLGREGGAGGYRVHRFVDKAGRECAYYDTTLLFPQNAQNLSEKGTGVAVLDMSNPAKPVRTESLLTPAMQTPHESLVLNTRRGLLAAVMGNPTVYPGHVDIYDVNEDCRHPVLQSSLPVGLLGHESGFAPDGRTFYATSIATGHITAVDVTNPRVPVTLAVGEYPSHGLTVSDDGNRGYVAASGTGLIILDLSEVQARKPNPQMREISRLTWDELTIPQVAIPVTIGGKPFVVEVDEFASAQNSTQPSGNGPKVGAARIIDIQNERAPRVVSNIRLAVHQPENRPQLAGDPGATSFVQGYAGHYCWVPQRTEPGIVACSFILSGLRVFDIRDPYNPREIAYFVAPVKPSPVLNERSNFAMSAPDFVPSRGEIWYSDGNSGFYALKVANGVWPFGAGRSGASRCLPRRLAVSGRRIGPARLGRSFAAFARRYRANRRGRRATRFCVRGGGRFWVAARKGRIDFIATTARGHRTRRLGPGRRVRRLRIRGTRRIGRGLRVGHRVGGGRVVYGLRGRRIRFLAVLGRRQAVRGRTVARRLASVGLRRR